MLSARSAAESIFTHRGGICTDCHAQLAALQPFAAAHLASDYYSYLATQAGPLFRLNCEELTGQTNKSDSRKRQRLFQDICLPRPDEIEITDPDRSTERNDNNGSGSGHWISLRRDDGKHAADAFQLSAARRSRRPARGWLSVALTLCRGRSHDDYYFSGQTG